LARLYRAVFSDPEWDALLRLRERCRELPARAAERLPTEDDAA